MEKINIKELKGEVNYIFYNYTNLGLEHLKLSNKICDIVGGATNEILQFVNNNNN